MPLSALRYVAVDYTLALGDIPAQLELLTRQPWQPREVAAMSHEPLEIETRIALGDDALQAGVRSLGEPSFQTCPECHGSMVAIRSGQLQRFRCHTGHAFTSESLAESARRFIEDTLWSALAQLEQYQVLLDQGSDAKAARRAKELKALSLRVRHLAMDPALRPDET